MQWKREVYSTIHEHLEYVKKRESLYNDQSIVHISITDNNIMTNPTSIKSHNHSFSVSSFSRTTPKIILKIFERISYKTEWILKTIKVLRHI